ncbi:DUF3014 domain-containing protein [Polaromonas sp.]|uniref:DUF3014 domain-containing protein n=1 Tax=Polaromonas sp. TaxID=1869339 RepID=UPI0032669069
MKIPAPGLLMALLFAAVAAGGFYWWQQGMKPAPLASDAPAPTVPAAPASASTGPSIQYPIDAAKGDSDAPPAALPALAEADAYVASALADLLGREKVQTFLHLEGFARRVVATTDNLARDHAAPALWPVTPTPGRFATLDGGAATSSPTSISPDNSQRYTPFVLFVESIDTARAVRLYARLYPLFQQAYEELGFPGRYFNDRLVSVIDLLLATPVQTGPLGVSLVEVKGPLPSVRPWVRYEFTDSALRSLSSGQKMLLRTGPVNHRRLNAKLMEIRRLVSGGQLAPTAGTSRP